MPVRSSDSTGASGSTLRQLLVVALFLAVCLWLWLSSERPSFIKRLTEVQRAGELHVLGDDETDAFSKLVDRLSEIADCGARLVVDGPLSDPGLKVFVTDAASTSELTGCERGNAVYDSALDSIFIDSSVLSPPRSKGTFASLRLHVSEASLSPEKNAYLTFMLLHELAHYCLHRDANTRFDFLFARGAELEAQADRWALERMRELSRRESKGTRRLGSYRDGTNQRAHALLLPRGVEIASEDALALALANFAYDLIEGLLFSDSAFSPFSNDSAHPGFVERIRGPLEEIRESAEDSPLGIFVAAALTNLTRLSDVRSRLVATVSSPEPIRSATFGRNGIYVLTDASKVYELAKEQFADLGSEHQPVALDDKSTRRLDAPPPSSRGGLIQLLEFEEGRPLAFVPHTGFVDLATGSVWECGIDATRIPYLVMPPRPPSYVLAIDGGIPERIVHSIDRTGVTASVEERDLCQRFDVPSGGCMIELQPASSELRAIAKTTIGDTRFGMLLLDAHTLSVTEYSAIDPPSDSVAVLAGDEAAEYYAVTSNFDPYRRHADDYVLSLSRGTGTGAAPTTLVGQKPLLQQIIPMGASPMDWAAVPHTPVLACSLPDDQSVVCHDFLDEVSLADLGDGRFYTLFHPPGGYAVDGRDSLSAFWVPGGYKLYIVDRSKHRLIVEPL